MNINLHTPDERHMLQTTVEVILAQLQAYNGLGVVRQQGSTLYHVKIASISLTDSDSPVFDCESRSPEQFIRGIDK